MRGEPPGAQTAGDQAATAEGAPRPGRRGGGRGRGAAPALGPGSRSRISFFQAEDGIRDYRVTGVQTCGLPIDRKSTRLNSSHTIISYPVLLDSKNNTPTS